MRLLTQADLSKVLEISITAICELVYTGRLPFHKIDGDNILFSADSIIRYIESPLAMEDLKYLTSLKKRLWENGPDKMKELKDYGSHFDTPQPPKRYYLEPVKNKKIGTVLYVRYLDNGKIIPSHWSTHTNDRGAAEHFAIANREKLLSRYYDRKTVKKPNGALYAILKRYYSENSPYLEIDAMRGRTIAEKSRVTYHNFVNNQFIPYLKKNGVKEIEDIDTPLLSKFQQLLFKGTVKRAPIMPQTINHYMSQISLIFDHLIQEGHAKTNPCKSLVGLKITEEQLRGCYEITKLKGVFNKKWKDEFPYLLCLVIYTTGMRNSEIERITVNDIIAIDGIRFIDIAKSKTKNGIRIVPLHDFVYRKITSYIKKTGKRENDLIFCNDKR